MDDDLHDIDNLFFNALEPKLQPPSNKVWDRIDAQLNVNDSNKKPVFFNLKRTLAVSAITFFAFLSVIGYRLYHPKSAAKQNNTVDDKTVAVKNKRTTSFTNGLKNKPLPVFTNSELDTVLNRDPVSKLRPSNQVVPTITVKRFKNNKGDISQHKASNANKFGSNKIKKSFTNELTTNELAKTIQIPDSQNVLAGDRIFLASRINSNGMILKLQSAETPPAFTNKLNAPITHLTLQSTANNTAKSKSIALLNTGKSRWYLSIFGAQEWQGYQLQDNDDHNNQQNNSNDKNSIKHREDEDPSPAAGVNIGYQINKKFSVEMGVRFGGYHIRTDSAKIYAENNGSNIAYKLITSSGYAYFNGAGGSLPLLGDSLTAQKVKQNINYIGVPIMLRYKIGNGKLSFNPALGLVFNFITASTVSADLNGTQGNDLQHVNLSGLRSFSAVIMFNPSIYYRVGSKIAVGVEPYFNYNISPINNTNVVKSYPYGLGLGAGIKYSF